MRYAIADIVKGFVKDSDFESKLPYHLDFLVSEAIVPKSINVKKIISDILLKSGWDFIVDNRKGYYLKSDDNCDFGICFTSQEKGHTLWMHFFDLHTGETSKPCYYKRCRNIEEANCFFKNALIISDIFADFYKHYSPNLPSEKHPAEITVCSDDMNLCLEEIANMGYKLKEPQSCKLQVSESEPTVNCTIYAFEEYPFYFYEFDDSSIAEKYFNELSKAYSAVSHPICEKIDAYKKCEYDIKEKQFRNVVIQFDRTVFCGSEFYNKDSNLEYILKSFNYFKTSN